MPRKSPRETSQSPASGSRRSSRIASLTKEEATPPRASRALAESPSAGKSPSGGRTRVRTPVKTPAKASPKTPTSQRRGQKRKTDGPSTPTSKRGRQESKKQEEEEEEPENEVEENEKDEADAGPSGDIAADDVSKADETKEAEKDKSEEEPMETEVEEEDEKKCETAPDRAQIECPSIKITPPIEETKPVAEEDQPMETAQVIKPIDTSPQDTSKLPEAGETAEPTDSRPDTNTIAQVSVAIEEQEDVENEDVELVKDTPAATPEADQAKEVDDSLEKATEDQQDSAQEQVVPDQNPEELTATTDCKNDGVEAVDMAAVTPNTEVTEETIPEKKQVAVTGEEENSSTDEKKENDIKTVEETVTIDTSQQTKEKVEVTNGQSDTKHLESPDATAVKESPQMVDSQSSGVISVGTN